MRGLQEEPGLFDGQRAALRPGSRRRRDDRGHVAHHEPLPLGVPEDLDEDAADLAQAGPGVAGDSQVLEEQRHVLGAELPDSAGAEGGHEVLAHRPRPHL